MEKDGTHVEVVTDEVDVVLSHVCVQSSEQISGGIAFLGKRHCESEREGTRGVVKVLEPQGLPCLSRVLACRSFVKSKYCSVGLECVPVERDGEVRVTCVRDELVRDMWHVITGFL